MSKQRSEHVGADFRRTPLEAKTVGGAIERGGAIESRAIIERRRIQAIFRLNIKKV